MMCICPCLCASMCVCISGSGLGGSSAGRSAPVRAGDVKSNTLGLGATQTGEVKADDDEYETYKKRMVCVCVSDTTACPHGVCVCRNVYLSVDVSRVWSGAVVRAQRNL